MKILTRNSYLLKKSVNYVVKRLFHDELKRTKLSLIEAELKLRHLIEPKSYPEDKLPKNEELLDYLCYLHEFKPSNKISWLDISYRKREKALKQFYNENNQTTNNITFPILDHELEKKDRQKQLSKINFNTNIIFDITFDDYMSSLEAKNLVEQLIRIIYFNKNAKDSFDEASFQEQFNIHLTGLSQSDKSKSFLNHLFPENLQIFFPNVFLHEKSFIELFPSDKLIYLSPHSDNVLDSFHSDHSYIIGGIVDRREIIELTPVKISKLGLKSARLPLPEDHKKYVQSLVDVFKVLYGLKSFSKVDTETVVKVTNKYLINNK